MLDRIAGHDLGSGPEGDLLLIKHKSVGEDLGDAFQLVVGGDDEMAGFRQIEKAVGEMAAAFDIESVKRFVEKKNVGFLREGAGDESTLLLSAGKLIDLAVGNVAELHRCDGLLGFFAVDFFEATEMTDVWKATHRDNITNANGKVALMVIDLRKVSDFLAEGGERLLPPVELSFLRREKTSEQSDEGAFARAVGTEEGEALTTMSGEGDVAESFFGAVAEADIFQIELVMFVAHFSTSHWQVNVSVASTVPQRVKDLSRR